MRQIYIIIPVFNEERVIGSVIDDIKKNRYKNIIVVNDGSTDNTEEIVKRKEVILLSHIFNRGKGAAVKTGIQAAKLLRARGIVTIDGDGQHDPSDICNLVKNLKKYDVILGSRSEKDKPHLRKIANFIGNLFTFLLYGLFVRDSQSGLRSYSRKAIDAINTLSDRYEFDSEVIREIAQKKLSFTEVPIHIKYTDYSLKKLQRQSFLNGLKTLIKLVISS